MATKQQIFEKITELLNDINDQYDDLQADKLSEDGLETDLFEATANYFAAHVALYNKLHKRDTGEVGASAPPIQDSDDELESEQADEPDDVQQIVFTPPIDSEAEQASHAEQVEEVSSDDNNEGDDQSNEDTDQEDTDNDSQEKVADTIAEDTSDDEEEPVSAKDEQDAEEDEGNADEEIKQAVDTDEEKGNGESDERKDNNSEPVDETNDEFVNEVTIAEKEVSVEPMDAPQATPSEAEKPARPLSINEMMSAQRKAGTNPIFAARRGESERIADLKSAISLNDKLLFIKDLFNGYSLAYSEAIELLNRYDDFAAAEAFLQANYAEKNNWAAKQTTVDKLYAVMRKRFG
ncbi:hypothetical protein [Parapedobacter tibetensis]|uniref:hypothetical protein n=1 Tax=Parapedobacter tibetensis TaxID=2972951 RepID=UPI00214D4428|nr:hypothetical protein [Parapedobacter tibetensis]